MWSSLLGDKIWYITEMAGHVCLVTEDRKRFKVDTNYKPLTLEMLKKAING